MILPGQPYAASGGILLHNTANFSESELATGLALARQIAPSLFRLQTCDITPASAFAWLPSPEDVVQWRNGTGFLLTPALVATANHVSAGCVEKLDFVSLQHGKVTGRLEAFDEKRDLAILRIPEAAASALPLRPASEPLQPGELCFAMGFPMDWQEYDKAPALIISPGRYVGTMPMNSGGICFASEVNDDLSRDVYHFQMVAVNGHSGSPIVDAQGRVVGVFVASFAWHNKTFVQPLIDMHRAKAS